MPINAAALDAFFEANLGVAFPAARAVVLVGGQTVYDAAFGAPEPGQPDHPTWPDTRFDLASVSKLFAVAAFMTLVEEGAAGLDQPVREVLPDFDGSRAIGPYPDPRNPGAMVQVVPASDDRADAGRVTFRNLLAHNSGLPAWLPIWRIGQGADAGDIARRRGAVAQSAFAYPTGARVVYSDLGLMLLGFAIEALTGRALREVVRERVCAPLGLASVDYGPIPAECAAPTEFYAHQGRRMRGEVHDENAWSLGGASGHAGLFAAAGDVAAFGEALRTCALLAPATLREMTRPQAQDGAVRRGLGFALWSHASDAASNPLSPLAFGHLGFTGTSLWIDPARALVVACLTNHVYYGRGGPDTLTSFRVGLHRLIADAMPPHAAPAAAHRASHPTSHDPTH